MASTKITTKECEGSPALNGITYNSSALWQAHHKTKIFSLKVKLYTNIFS